MAGKYLDEETITAIFDEFAPVLYKYALLLCHNPRVGDHIVGDAFAQLLGQFGIGKPAPPDVRVYLYQSAYRSLVEYLRDSHPNPPLEPVVGTSDQSGPQDEKEALMYALKDALTEDQRHVVILYFLENFNINETSKILGKNSGEIRARLKEIRKIKENQPGLLTESLAALLNKKRRRRKPK